MDPDVIIRTVRDSADAAPGRSAFAAAFLSLLFPGLGHAYGGAPARGLLLAAPAVLVAALGAGLLVDPAIRRDLAFSLLDTNVLILVFVANLALLAYRLFVIIDAYRVTATLEAWRRAGDARLGRPRVRPHLLSIAGLLAVLIVGSGAHAAVAYYDLTAYDLLRTITGEAGRPSATGTPPGTSLPTAQPTGGATEVPTDAPPSERVNILVLGVDQRPRENTFNTDTMIVVSIDPRSRQVAMLSLPRDAVDVPLPRSWPAYSYYGGAFPAKITSLWTYATGSPSLYPFPDGERGPEALKGALGELYGLDIPYYVQVDFDGFRRVVDTLGGVTVRVDLPVQDDKYPQEFGRGSTRLFIPPTVQYMTGDEALAYARSRHGSNDFDRAHRQQGLLLALRQQADVRTMLARLPELVAALKDAVKTDIPTSMLPRIASLAEEVGLDHVRSVVFSPPRFAREVLDDPSGRGYVIIPRVTVIRQTVSEIFAFDPDLEASREAIAAERAGVRVLNGSGISGQAGAIRDYLVYRGFDATVPTAGGGRADRDDYATTVVTVYNGAESRLGKTIALLKELFGVTVVPRVDPNVTVDVVIITGQETPKLTVP